ncbi:aldo/keto reductase [Streptomyces sp. WAC 00631]|uniref:aldo/keto reductase n=1 Tax=Streptomyces sp. WAC 00631 TaxID=2203201 RepID=UPI001E56AFF6|nr:aldo/keto reductase [Streptomyces sp. WAC 00631]MCC5037243.1 aldo/keto reductase [Streptomyces sp. WAC 00631]
MRYQKLAGGAGPEVSVLCLGVMAFGTTVDEETSFAILDRFAEAGGTFLDTSNNYAWWVDGATGDEAELLLGRWLKSRGARDRMVVATKVGARPDLSRGPLWCDKAPDGFGNMEGLSAGAIRAGLEGSLRRLGTDRVDLHYAHIEDRSVPLEETVGAFAGLVADGRAGLPGVSNHPAGRIAEARRTAARLGLPGYRCVQQRHTYLRPRPDADFGVQRHTDAGLFDYAAAQPDLTLLGYSTLMHGAYTREDKELPPQYEHEGSARRLRVLREVAAESGATPNQVVQAWMLGGRVPVLPVLGVSTVAQLDELLAAAELDLDVEARARLDAA